MEMNRKYIPVSCDFVDLIEIKATQKVLVHINYKDRSNTVHTLHTRIKTWETRNKVEYLITIENEEIRLDDVISIDGINSKNSCRV